MNDHIFALDIGTQSVTGILLEQTADTYRITKYCTKHHKERSMLDGQIHNVVAVTQIIKEVKEHLEEEYGQLQHVFVAAAGRALKTVQASMTIDLKEKPITNDEMIKHLELSAVQNAQIKLAQDNKKGSYDHYYCVGYSVLHYTLDGEPIGSIIEQSGNEASVEIIATFLPKVVVESLLAALERANLKIKALTLEPIAAAHVLVPDSMRRLNIALVDIGAGTSDIAITNRGTVVAYGMVPVAGDEITEAISDHYLLDFHHAERAKQDIVNHGEAVVSDILGFEKTITATELKSEISSDVGRLATVLTEEILRLNGKAPKAVMLIGGGSLTPLISEKLAESLQLPTNRVAIRDISAIQNLQKDHRLPEGPDFVTPIGIAIAAQQNPIDYSNVTVNGQIIRLFQLKQLTIGDALIQAGIDVNKWYGKPGLAIIVTINDKEMTIPGSFGNMPQIYLNGEIKTVNEPIKHGDDIIIKKGKDGSHAHVTLKDVIGEKTTIPFYYNGKRKQLETKYAVNQVEVALDYVLKDRDSITFKTLQTIKEVIEHYDPGVAKRLVPFIITVNNKQINVTSGNTQVTLNGKRVNLSDLIKANDTLEVTLPAQEVTVKTLLQQLHKELWYSIKVNFNDKQVELKKQQLIITRDEKELNEETVLKSGDQLKINEKPLSTFIFQDVFRYVDIDLSQVKGSYKLLLNESPASFHETIKQGDTLEMTWE